MVLLGSFLNALFIIIGALVGRVFQNIPEKIKETALSIIGLAVAVLGIQMGFESDNFIIVIISLVVGAVLGEWFDLDRAFNRLGQWVESLFARVFVVFCARYGGFSCGRARFRGVLCSVRWYFLW